MTNSQLAIKVDVDTDRGTRIGVPNLVNLFKQYNIPATFLFSLGPDNTGRAIKRIFRPGFFKKVARTNVVGMYGLRTLLNGVLLPGPHIGKRNKPILQDVRAQGFEVGIHCYDHIRWQDGLHKMSPRQVFTEFGKARDIFKHIFTDRALTAGAAGWQANAHSLAAYDDAKLLYASDARGTSPFFPRINGVTYKTLQIPTTLPTLDELLGHPDHPEHKLNQYYYSLIEKAPTHVLTIHAEIEGMAKLDWFSDFLQFLQQQQTQFMQLSQWAKSLLTQPKHIPVCDLVEGKVPGRSGTLAVQA